MASEVDICNLALADLGDDATVTEIDPPEGSSQAEHCARFYPVARDAFLQMHDWGFNTSRITPALIGSGVSEWLYAYALPSNCLKVLAVLPLGSTDDNNSQYFSSLDNNNPYFQPKDYIPGAVGYAPQPFSVETITDKDGNDTDILYTNVATPDVRFVKRVTDTTRFSPTAIIGLYKLLASLLAGPVYKGEVGVQMAQAKEKSFFAWFNIATGLDANQRQTKPQHSVSWIAGRR